MRKFSCSVLVLLLYFILGEISFSCICDTVSLHSSINSQEIVVSLILPFRGVCDIVKQDNLMSNYFTECYYNFNNTNFKVFPIFEWCHLELLTNILFFVNSEFELCHLLRDNMIELTNLFEPELLYKYYGAKRFQYLSELFKPEHLCRKSLSNGHFLKCSESENCCENNESDHVIDNQHLTLVSIAFILSQNNRQLFYLPHVLHLPEVKYLLNGCVDRSVTIKSDDVNTQNIYCLYSLFTLEFQAPSSLNREILTNVELSEYIILHTYARLIFPAEFDESFVRLYQAALNQSCDLQNKSYILLNEFNTLSPLSNSHISNSYNEQKYFIFEFNGNNSFNPIVNGRSRVEQDDTVKERLRSVNAKVCYKLKRLWNTLVSQGKYKSFLHYSVVNRLKVKYNCSTIGGIDTLFSKSNSIIELAENKVTEEKVQLHHTCPFYCNSLQALYEWHLQTSQEMSISQSIALLYFVFAKNKSFFACNSSEYATEHYIFERCVEHETSFDNSLNVYEFIHFSQRWIHLSHMCSCLRSNTISRFRSFTEHYNIELQNKVENERKSKKSASSLPSETEDKELVDGMERSHSFVIKALEYAVGTLYFLSSRLETSHANIVMTDNELQTDYQVNEIPIPEHSLSNDKLNTVKGILLYYQSMWHGSHQATSSLATMKEHGIWQRQNTKVASALLLHSMSLTSNYLYRKLLQTTLSSRDLRFFDTLKEQDMMNCSDNKHKEENVSKLSIRHPEKLHEYIYEPSELTRFERPFLIENSFNEIDYPTLSRSLLKHLTTVITSYHAVANDRSGVDDADDPSSSNEFDNEQDKRKAVASLLFVKHLNRTSHINERMSSTVNEKVESASLLNEHKSKLNKQAKDVNTETDEAKEENKISHEMKLEVNYSEEDFDLNNKHGDSIEHFATDVIDEDKDDDDDDYKDDDDEDNNLENELWKVWMLSASSSLQISNIKNIPFDAKVAKELNIMILRRLRYSCDVDFAERVISKAKTLGINVNEWPISDMYKPSTSFEWDREELNKLWSEVNYAQVACFVPKLLKSRLKFDDSLVNATTTSTTTSSSPHAFTSSSSSSSFVSPSSPLSTDNTKEIAIMALPQKKVYKLLQKALLELSYISTLDHSTSLQAASYAMLSIRLSKAIYLQGVARAQQTWKELVGESIQIANFRLDQLRNNVNHFSRASLAHEWKRIVQLFNMTQLLRQAIRWEERHEEWVSEQLFRQRLRQIKAMESGKSNKWSSSVDEEMLNRLARKVLHFQLTLPSFAQSELIRQEALVFLVTNSMLLMSSTYKNSNDNDNDKVVEGIVSQDATNESFVMNYKEIRHKGNENQSNNDMFTSKEEHITEVRNTPPEVSLTMELMEELLLEIFHINISTIESKMFKWNTDNADVEARRELHTYVHLHLLLAAMSMRKESTHSPHIIDHAHGSQHVTDAFYLMCNTLYSMEEEMRNVTETNLSVVQSMRWLALNRLSAIIPYEQTFLPRESDSVTSYCNRLSRFVQKHLHTTFALSQRVEHGLMSDNDATGLMHGMSRFVDSDPLLQHTLMLFHNAKQMQIERGELSLLLYASDLDASLDASKRTLLMRVKRKIVNWFYGIFTETADEMELRELGLLLLPFWHEETSTSTLSNGNKETSSVPYFRISSRDAVSAEFVQFYLQQFSSSSAFRKFVIATQLTSLTLQSGKPQGFALLMHEALTSRQNVLNTDFITQWSKNKIKFMFNNNKCNDEADCHSKGNGSNDNSNNKICNAFMFELSKSKQHDGNKFLNSIADYLSNDVWGKITASAWHEEHVAAQWHDEKTRAELLNLPFSLNGHTPFKYSSSETRQELLSYIDRWQAKSLLLQGERAKCNYYTHDSNNNNNNNNDNNNNSVNVYDNNNVTITERGGSKEESRAIYEREEHTNKLVSKIYNLHPIQMTALSILSRCTSYLWFVAWMQHTTQRVVDRDSYEIINVSPFPFDGMQFPAGNLECGIDLYTYLSLLKTGNLPITKATRLELIAVLNDLNSRLRYYYKLTEEKIPSILQNSVFDLDINEYDYDTNDDYNSETSGKNSRRYSIDSEHNRRDDVNTYDHKSNHDREDDVQPTFLVEPWNNIKISDYKMSMPLSGDGVHFNQRLHRLTGVGWGLRVVRA